MESTHGKGEFGVTEWCYNLTPVVMQKTKKGSHFSLFNARLFKNCCLSVTGTKMWLMCVVCLRRCVNNMTAAEWGAGTTGRVWALTERGRTVVTVKRIHGEGWPLCFWPLCGEAARFFVLGLFIPVLALVLTLCWTNYSESEMKLLSLGHYLIWFLFRDDFGYCMIHCFHPFTPHPPIIPAFAVLDCS